MCFVFSDWLVSEDKDPAFEDKEKVTELADNLREFYGCARNKNGDLYGKSSLVNLRAGLNRHLTSPPYNMKVNLMKDRIFQDANQVFVGLVRKMRMEGLSQVTHKDAISTADMQKLYSSGTLGTQNPESLMYKVYVDIALHFCRRGREGLRELTKSSFTEKLDENNQAYVTLSHMPLEKNHQGISKKDDNIEMPRMYEQPGDDSCPVSSFRVYMSKLNVKCSAFFQKPNSNWQSSGLWFCNMPVGKNLICNFMSRISEKAGLSKRYTNHCLRVTAIDVLSKHGVEPADICVVSRHRNTESLKSYSKGPSDEKRHSMSDMLHKHSKVNTQLSIPSSSTSQHRPTSPQTHVSPVPMSPIPSTSNDMSTVAQRSMSPAPVPGTSNQVVNSSMSNMLQRSMFAGASFMDGSAPVFNFNGNINFY